MKPLFCIFILILVLACNRKNEIKVLGSAILNVSQNVVKLHKLQKLSVTGDFDGDGKSDTIFQHNYSRLRSVEIDSAADPYQNEWDTVANWFYRQHADLYLTMNGNKQDALHLGTAQGLYCLINVGDNNGDRKDEIALVIDNLDDSRLNSCKIYSLCSSQWTLLKEFEINEDAFDYSGNKPEVVNEIKGYLEIQNGSWVYMDNYQEQERKEGVAKMKRLQTKKCK